MSRQDPSQVPRGHSEYGTRICREEAPKTLLLSRSSTLEESGTLTVPQPPQEDSDQGGQPGWDAGLSALPVEMCSVRWSVVNGSSEKVTVIPLFQATLQGHQKPMSSRCDILLTLKRGACRMGPAVPWRGRPSTAVILQFLLILVGVNVPKTHKDVKMYRY